MATRISAAGARSAGLQAGVEQGIVALTFGGATLLSAALLFLVQPMVARLILPWYGGSAAVWTTCLLFFQLLLLAGYAYGDLLHRWVMASSQPVVHLVVVMSVALLVVAGGAEVSPVRLADSTGGSPVLEILAVLLLTIGAPYLVLSTTGPLLQSWLSLTRPSVRFYRLYALSNAGSIAALLLYPTVIEPAVSAGSQGKGWAAAYLAFSILASAVAWLTWRAFRTGSAALSGTPSPAGAHEHLREVAGRVDLENSAGPSRQLSWLALSAAGSLLLLSITAHITQNIASVPFLWIAPLSIYLASFILCFDGSGWYWRRFYRTAALVTPVVLLLAAHVRFGGSYGLMPGTMPASQAIPLYCAGLFVLCMFCHGELAASKPAVNPTRFYLMLACGGAIGGVTVAVVAPVAFTGLWELPIALVLISLLLVPRLGPWARRMSAILLALVIVLAYLGEWGGKGSVVAKGRNFYGAVKVIDEVRDDGSVWRTLRHGVIVHGGQVVGAQSTPETYYSAKSGLGITVTALREARQRPLRLGVIGLGAGSIAGLGRQGDVIRFYEIDPQIREYAERYFGFLRGSAAQVEHRIGDGRLSLAQENPQAFDLLVLDAFSGDSIPVHLLTREAMDVYRRHLRSDGAMLVHISNLYLDLRPVVTGMAETSGMSGWYIRHAPAKDESFATASHWGLLTSDLTLAGAPGIRAVAEPLIVDHRFTPWTDDYSNIFQLLK